MFVIVGFIIVFACVFGGYGLAGGAPAVMIQPIEWLIIGGAGLGALIASSPSYVLKAVGKGVAGAFTKQGYTKEQYTELLLLLYELTKTAKGNMLALEAHIENPENSEIFKRYPGVMKNHHAIDFISDTLKVQISSPVSPYDLEDMMDTDMKAEHGLAETAAGTVNRMADAFPGLGIVAAVIGVVLTMGKLDQGKTVIGQSVAAALVGTFIGILLCYGFVQPLAAKMTEDIASDGKYMDVVKVSLLAFAKDCSPKVCVEFARRSISPDKRPTFNEIDEATSNIKGS